MTDVFLQEHFVLNRMVPVDRSLAPRAVRNARPSLQIAREIAEGNPVFSKNFRTNLQGGHRDGDDRVRLADPDGPPHGARCEGQFKPRASGWYDSRSIHVRNP
jgi:hypothetical protein